MLLGAVAPRDFAENELKLSLSTGEENARNSKGKLKMLVDPGGVAPGGFGRNEAKLNLRKGGGNGRNFTWKLKIGEAPGGERASIHVENAL